MPEQLARFVASEWPGAKCQHEALRQWSAACRVWLDANPGRVLPFGEYGDGIDVLREQRRYRQGMPVCPDEYRPAVHWVRGQRDGVA